MKKDMFKKYAVLQLIFMVYSFGGVCSKAAAGCEFLSLRFCLFYGIEIALLGFYAIAWQQVIKNMPLTLAFSNKGVTVLWAMVWGRLFFSEPITPVKILGVLLVVSGIILYANSDDTAGEKNG